MTPGHQDPVTALSRTLLRASHADRERVVDLLKAAFVQGRLTRIELDERLARTFGSRTYAELAALTADIPATAARPQAPARSTARRVSDMGLAMLLMLGVLLGQAFAGPGDPGQRLMFVVGVLIPIMSLLFAGLLGLHTWLERHAAAPRRRRR
jgi:hypothetical protein